MAKKLIPAKRKMLHIPSYAGLVFSVGTGLAIRLWASIIQPVFSDEAFSLFEITYWKFPYDPSYPPGYALFLKLWAGVSTELLWARIPSVIAGTLSLIVFWRMLQRHFSLQTANIGAFLLSLSALHIHYSWVARPNGMTSFIAALSLSQLLALADAIQQKRFPSTRALLLYLGTNAVGAFFCHGYSIFLAGSLLTLFFWIYIHLRHTLFFRDVRMRVLLLLLHVLLPVMQYFFVHGRTVPLIESAEWIPTFDIYAITSAFLTLFNGAKTLSSEMWTAAPVTVYFTLGVLIILGRFFYTIVKKHHEFTALLFVVLITVSIISVGIIDLGLGINTLQPRLLLPIHLLYILSLSVTLPHLVSAVRTTRRLPHPYETMFLAILLVFNLRSFAVLNIFPYYNTPETINTITELKDVKDHELLVFPRYQIITIKYLWGLENPYPRLLATSDKLHGLPQDASPKNFATHIPLHKPIRIVLWPYDAILSPGSQSIVDHLAPLCKKRVEANLAILSCPPVTDEKTLYD